MKAILEEMVIEKGDEKKDTYKRTNIRLRNGGLLKEKNNPGGGSISKKKASILVVDDEVTIRELFRKLLERVGYCVDVANDGHEAVEKAKNKSYPMAFIDIVMPGINGYLTLLELKKLNQNMKAVMMTGYSVESIVKDAMKKDAYACISKPFSRDDVLSLIARMEEKL